MFRKYNRGVTLVELIIVIAIMAILVGITVPAFTKYIEKSRKSKDIYTADQIARAVNTAFIENPDVYDAFTKWDKLYADVQATYNGETENYRVYLIAANEAPKYCFKGGESKFGDTQGKTGLYGVINRELGLDTSAVNTVMMPKHQVNGRSPKNPNKMSDRWRIC